MPLPLGAAPSIILGAGLGAAASTAITPVVEPARQEAWSNNPFRISDPAVYASLVAQGGIDLSTGAGLAKLNGFDADKFRGLVYLAQRAPDLAEVLELWRRGKIGEPLVDHALAKAQLEAQYWPALKELFNGRLQPPNVALAIVRGIMKDPGFLPVGPPTTEGKVKAFPVSTLDPLEEARAWGIDRDRLFVEVANTGRPAPPNEAARAVFRRIIDRVDFDRAISEGDLRNEWSETLFEVAREILSANNYAELELRGFYDAPKRRAKTAQHGLSDADSDDLVNLLGRSISVHQVTTGLARGGKYPGNYANVPEPFKSAIQRSNIRQEWAELDYANRYSYPSAFVFRALIQDGALTQAEGEQYLRELGWPPELAAAVAKAYAPKGAAASLNPRVKSEQSRFMTAAHTGYVKNGVARSVIEPLMEPLVSDLADRDAIFQLWSNERVIDGLDPFPGTPAA